SGIKRATVIVIPSVRFTKLIIHHLQRKHRFHPRPDSPLHLSNKEPVLGYLKFSAKGTKREIFGMPIPGRIITANIRAAPYYQEYQENVAKHRGFLAGETRSTQDFPAPRPAKPARKPHSTTQKAPPKPSSLSPVTSTQPAPTSVPTKTQENKRKGSPKSVGESEAEEVPAEEPHVADEDADFQKAMEESMKDAYALPKGPLPPVVIREPESGKYQPLPEVPGKGKAKVSEEQVAHDLLSLQKHEKSNREEESEKVVLGVEKGSQDEGQARPDPNAQDEGQTRSDTGAQAEGQAGSNPEETSEGQAGSNPDETSEGQTRPDPGNAEARVQSTSSPVVHAGSDHEHMDIDVANVSLQPSTKQLYEGFTVTIYPNVQENLKLAVEEPIDKPSDADKNAKTKVKSMVNVPIQQAMSSISIMTSPIIDLTSRPKSPKEHSQLKATTTDTTTTTTTTLPPPQAPQQSTTKAMMVKRIVNKTMEERLDKHGARLYTLDQLDIPQQVSIASIYRDQSEELTHDLAEERKKRKKGRELPKTPPGSPSHQPPPPPPPAGPSGTSGTPRAFGSQVILPPPPPTSINQDSPSTGLVTPSPAKIAATTKHQASSTPDVKLKPLVSLTPEDLDMDEAMDSLHAQTGDITTFMDRFCKRRGIIELKPQDLEGPAYEIVKAQRQQTTTTGAPPGQVTIQSDFFFNKDLEYLRYGSKGRRPALSISKMKAAYYPDAGLEQIHSQDTHANPQCCKNRKAFEDTENLSQPGELCWRTRQRGRLHTFKAYRLIKLLLHSRPLSVDFNSLVHSLRALSALRCFGLRTVSTAAKPCQGDSSKLYLITGRIPTVAAAGQKDVNSQLHTHISNLSSMNSKKTYHTSFATLMYTVMIQDRVRESLSIHISLSLLIHKKKWINNIPPLPKYHSWIQENSSNNSFKYNNIFNMSIMPCGSKYKTARELWAAILKTFGGNEPTKKSKKNLLKQQYRNFKAEGSETLEQMFNRLQVIVGQLQFMDIEIEQDDLNQMFLTTKHSSRNEDGNTACIPTASTNVPTDSASVATISQDTACAYIASQFGGSQIKFKDINQIDKDDMEEMDIKWNMALLSTRADKFWKKTEKKISIQGSDVAGFGKLKVECFNCHKMGHFARECRAPRNQDRGRRDNYRQGSKAEEQAPKALMAIGGVGWDRVIWQMMKKIMHWLLMKLLLQNLP
nr:hypothetical protein [Tanacetum cinerariifolium]